MGFMAIAAPLLAAGGQIMGGISENNQKRAEAAQYDQNAKATLTAADQSEALRREDLLSTLSSIDAVRSSRGLEVASPTGTAIRQNRTGRAEQAIGAENLNYRTQAQSYKTQAGISRSQGTSALIGGFLKGGSTAFGGISDAVRYG
jgi:hypothetical protein